MVKLFEERNVLREDFGDQTALRITFQLFLETSGSSGSPWRPHLGPWASLFNTWGSLVVLGPSLESPGHALGRPRRSWGVLGSALGRPWDPLGTPWGSPGTPWDIFGCPRGSIGIPWGPFGTLRLVLEVVEKQDVQLWRHPWVTLGRVWCVLCGCWALFGSH